MRNNDRKLSFRYVQLFSTSHNLQSINCTIIKYNDIPACGKSPKCFSPCVPYVYVIVSNVFHVLKFIIFIIIIIIIMFMKD